MTLSREPLATPLQVSEYLRIPEATLAQWRYLGRGPESVKVGRHCRYRWSAVDAWLWSDPHGAGGGQMASVKTR